MLSVVLQKKTQCLSINLWNLSVTKWERLSSLRGASVFAGWGEDAGQAPHQCPHSLLCGNDEVTGFRGLLEIKLEKHQTILGHFIPSNLHLYLKGNGHLNRPGDRNCQAQLRGLEG